MPEQNSPAIAGQNAKDAAQNFPAITEKQYQDAATLLNVKVSRIKAVKAVESAGNGFLPDGRLKILFEGHQFWDQLKKNGANPAKLLKENPSTANILYQKWDRSKYKGGTKEHDRLNQAIELCKANNIPVKCAYNAASYGAFQIMGFNHTACGFTSAEEMIASMLQSEFNQLVCFCKYLQSVGLVKYLRDGNWAAFARGYNGPGYKGNPSTTNDDYDLKLAAADKRYSQQQLGEKLVGNT